jgi:membrane-associated protein
MEHLLTMITGYGWLAVALVIFSESGLMIGFFMPGDSLLFTSGFLVQKSVININIHLFVLILFLAAILGNTCGYFIGRKLGRRLFDHPNRIFKKKYLHDAEHFYAKYGSKTIILAMFVPIIRAFAPVVAGAAKMDYRKFVTFNLIGAAAWVGIMTYLGYYGGKGLTDAGFNIEAIALIIIGLSLLPGVVHSLQNPATRAKLSRIFKRG